MTRALLVAVCLLLAPAWALAQGGGPPTPLPTTIFGPSTSLAVTGATASKAFPTGVAASLNSALLLNDGATEIFVALGGSAVTADTTGFPIPPGAAVSVFVGQNTYVAAITAGGDSLLRVTLTNGLLLMNAGTGGSSPEAAITAAAGSYSPGAFDTGAGVDGWDLTEGATDDAAASPGGTGSVSAKLRTISQLAADPCATQVTLSAPISVATATTTQLVAPSGTKSVYVCGFAFSVAPSATAAATAQLEYGTSTDCTGTHALTGKFGAGDLTSAAPPLPVSYGGAGHSVAATPASQGVCLVTTGTTVDVEGVLTYVQQ